MAGTEIRSFAKLRGQMPRIDTTGIAPWQTALKWTADCQVPRSDCQEYMRSSQACGNSRDGYSILGNPQSKCRIVAIRGAHLSAECGIRLKSSPRYFTSRIPLFKVSNIFAARLLEYKIPTRRIV
jgi:hypothetical protein